MTATRSTVNTGQTSAWLEADGAGAVLCRARESFSTRFWNEETGCLFDVVDVDHVRGTVDDSIRPNQILAVGGLPRPLVTGGRASRIVDVVGAQLLTPLGLWTLIRSHPQYVGHYEGSPATRDSAYHQGTAWPWLMGAFVDAWLVTRGDSDDARAEAG